MLGTSLMLLLACGGCAPSDDDANEWTLVWSDEFDGAAGSAPDDANWTFDVGGDGWGNEQLEFDTDRRENADLDGNGFLRITAIREDFEGNTWTSARMSTQGLQSFGMGRIEASIRLPVGRGLWPAFWSLGTDFPDVGWPSTGEIDIMEFRGEMPEQVLGSVHGPGYSGGEAVGNAYTRPEGSLATDFHVYAVEWDPRHIAWFVDDDLLGTVTPGDLPPGAPWVFDHEVFLILNLAVGGTFLQQPDASTPGRSVMGVDYVRVFERTVPIAGRSLL